MRSLRGVAVLLLASVVESLSSNMNGEYKIWQDPAAKGATFNSDYASKGHEYFDLYSPIISTRYGEVILPPPPPRNP